jgi:putative endonuclease
MTGDRKLRRVAAYGSGLRAETLAGWLLRLKGYRILAQRYASPVGEIDLVAMRGKTLVFVEVKARATLDGAALSISPYQRARIVRAAGAFLSRHPHLAGCEMRFDAILVAPGHLPRHLKAAFDTGA